MKLSKKGDLSLSINAIVILILAITMLGLGLAFIKNQFGGVTGKLQTMTDQIDAGQKAELEASPDRITFRTTDFSIKRGTQLELFYAVRNNLDTPNPFEINGFSCTDAVDIAGKEMLDDTVKPIVFEGLVSKELASGSSFVFPLIIKVNAGAIPTIYSCDLTVVHPTEKDSAGAATIYSKKEFFIKVTP